MRPEHEWFKPEKLTATYYTYEAIALAAVLLAAGGLVALGAFADAPLWVVGPFAGGAAAVFVFLTWWITAFYRTAAYRLTEAELEYRRGVFFQQQSTVPYNRITNVNATQGPIQRLLGAGSVGVHTAGYGGQMGAELTISAVGDYEEIKEQVMAHVRRRRPEATEGEEGLTVGSGAPDSSPAESSALAELRRIRELLEDGRAT
jgi:membrane protein YdbS with pleckstrin-like domain